ncbi:hypothetical protein AKO1_006768 [Acrasis kona]|uniref:Uncharacterized protein n=1 Tax=Acrasis kona TaxID=1008807 RepID=A0AAW2YTX7_9EUKA
MREVRREVFFNQDVFMKTNHLANRPIDNSALVVDKGLVPLVNHLITLSGGQNLSEELQIRIHLARLTLSHFSGADSLDDEDEDMV